LVDTDPWPLILLALRIATVGLLYIFLLTAFRALRADLRASSAPERTREEVPGAAVATPAGAVAGWADRGLPAARPAYPATEDAWDQDEDDWEQAAPPLGDDASRPRRSRVRPRVWLPVTAAILVAAFGGTALIMADQNATGEPPAEASSGTASDDPFEPPTVVPDPGRVTVGLAATEDAQLRVTVDGVVEFEGTLRSGERKAYEGSERIQVWTDSGKTVQLAVNGVDLGAYSPAMGHPDWNRIDYGFWPGWGQ